jgi:DNA-binding HxlR family transcriptional regulator
MPSFRPLFEAAKKTVPNGPGSNAGNESKEESVMPATPLSSDRIELIRLIDAIGSSVCVGTCEHRKPGEWHCHNIGQALKISSAGAKRRLRELVQLGYLDRRRVEREDGKVIALYTVSQKGQQLLKP